VIEVLLRMLMILTLVINILSAAVRISAEPDSGTPSSTPVPTARPAAKPVTRKVAGTATWYRYVPGHAAAGPALRAALGPRWRGKTVTACDRAGRCVRAVLSDWCACGGGRVIDLDHRLFARLAPTSRGVIHVEVRLP
jgi:hypothetical protein